MTINHELNTLTLAPSIMKDNNKLTKFLYAIAGHNILKIPYE